MTNEVVVRCIERLDSAYKSRSSIEALSEFQPSLSIDDAYEVQMQRVKVAVANGDIITGKKIGLTSKAMQDLLGVDQPDYGHLHQSMLAENGDVVELSKLFQPKVEGEIAFILKEDLVGPEVTVDDVLRATDYVVAAIEIVDSRVKDWKIKLADTVADNASCGMYVLGAEKVPLQSVNLKEVEMQLFKNGEKMNEGKGTDVLGDPALCVAWLANKLSSYGVTLKAGEVILSGALSAAVNVTTGDEFVAKFTQLGEVKVSFK